MTIDFFTSSSNLHIRQSFISPGIYLDHWALSLFSEDINLQNRLIRAIKDKKGTLVISIINFMEFASATDPKHSLETESFLDKVLPNIYFADFDIDKVKNKENNMLNNEDRFWPSADLFHLHELYQSSTRHNKPTTAGMFQKFQAERKYVLGLKAQVILDIRNAIDSTFKETSYKSKARNIDPNNERTRTSIILGELLRDFVLDSNANMSDNDIIDLAHAWTSTNCCDYSLLDNAWRERVKKMECRIQKSSIKMPIAKCYSKKHNGIESFIDSLEAFNLNDATKPIP